MKRFGRRDLPRVTLLIPCFNAGDYVRDAIRCALSQTYAHVEVIVAPDDGETYRHLRQEFTSGQLRIIAPGRECGTGAGATRNRAIDAASGDFFAMLDADDLIPPEYVEKLMAVALEDGIAVAPSRYISWVGAQIRKPPVPPGYLSLSGFGQTLASIHPLIHRSLEQGYPSGFAQDVVHDGIVIAKMGAVKVVPDCSYDIRIRPGSACSGQNPEEAIQAAYTERIHQMRFRPSEIGAQCLGAHERADFADLFRFRAMVSRAFSQSRETCYNTWVEGKEADLWDQFSTAKAQDDVSPAQRMDAQKDEPIAQSTQATELVSAPSARSDRLGAD